MNRKIYELALQAGFSTWVLNPSKETMSGTPELLKKFAELIVRECADVIQKKVSMKYKDGGETEEFMGGHYAGSVLARVEIRKHFGVEK